MSQKKQLLYLKKKKTLNKALTARYSSLIKDNSSNTRFLFSTRTRPTKSQGSVGPTILLTIALSSNEFIHFFTNKFLSSNENVTVIHSLSSEYSNFNMFSSDNRSQVVLPAFKVVIIKALLTKPNFRCKDPSTYLLVWHPWHWKEQRARFL